LVAQVSLIFLISLIIAVVQCYCPHVLLTFWPAGGRTPADRAAVTPLYFLGLAP
jgi:hypothetical protein